MIRQVEQENNKNPIIDIQKDINMTVQEYIDDYLEDFPQEIEDEILACKNLKAKPEQVLMITNEEHRDLELFTRLFNDILDNGKLIPTEGYYDIYDYNGSLVAAFTDEGFVDVIYATRETIDKINSSFDNEDLTEVTNIGSIGQHKRSSVDLIDDKDDIVTEFHMTEIDGPAESVEDIKNAITELTILLSNAFKANQISNSLYNEYIKVSKDIRDTLGLNKR